MENINLPAVFVANAMGLVLCIMMIIGIKWKVPGTVHEKVCLKILLISSIVSCLIDPLVFYFDGKETIFATILNYAGNFWLFMSNMIVGPAWFALVVYHVVGELKTRHKIFISIICTIGTCLLVLNFFTPIVFTVNEKSIYTRGSMYWLFTIIQILFFIYSILVYLAGKKRGGVLIFFPVFQFAVPIVIGISIQLEFYGLSTIWPFLSLSLASVMIGLLNEAIYKDRLTGLYNRYYLDNVKNQISKNERSVITAMMLDMNAFKRINDEYGHSEGDEALVATSDILIRSIGSLGSVIRYAGDEFVILLNTQTYSVVEKKVETIRNKLNEYNTASGKPYKLSVSIGYSMFDFGESTIDELFKEIDEKMYEDKKKYYESTANDRRISE